ncbi:hypothetical protein A2U01_0102456, partial [Trifolium medium]|nr:hypothetical protein [Trifolium medium]
VMTPQEFQTFANWPGDRPPFGEGVSTAAAGADDEDADEAAANAFIDEGDDDAIMSD